MAFDYLEFEKPLAELEQRIDELRRFSEAKGLDLSEEIRQLQEKADEQKRHIYSHLSAWQKALVARHMKRPRTMDYVSQLFEEFIPLHGDRIFRDDRAVVGGPARFEGQSVMVIGHQKGKDTKESLDRNFGMAHPEGYRKALRLMKMAEKFHRPVLMFIDTPAAYPGIGAEERGQAEAIARNLREMSTLETPIVVIIHGEGGSGGALALAVGDRILIFEHAIYSVIPPEGCAAILWKDSSRAAEAAEVLRMTATDLLALGVVDEIVSEPLGGAHRNHEQAVAALREALRGALRIVTPIPLATLIEQRYQKFRKLGTYEEEIAAPHPSHAPRASHAPRPHS